MYELDKNYTAPHSSIVLGLASIIAPIVYTLSSLLFRMVTKITAFVIKFRFPKKDTCLLQKDTSAPAPHVALVTVPGNFVTSAFKTW